MAYVKINENMQQYNAVEAVLAAQKRFGFRFHTVQTDNGCEFGKKFQDEITRRGIKYRPIRAYASQTTMRTLKDSIEHCAKNASATISQIKNPFLKLSNASAAILTTTIQNAYI